MVTDQMIIQVKQQIGRLNRKVARLERTQRLQQLERHLKNFKKLRFIKEDGGVRVISSLNKSMDGRLITFNTYDEILSTAYAIRKTLTHHYLFPWRNSV